MRVDLAKWELELLIENRYRLKVDGRSGDYDDEKRMTKLREFLDLVVDESTELEPIVVKQESF